METVALDRLESVKSLVAQSQATDEPVVVFDGDDECMIAMRPAVFERILFDTHLLNSEGRPALVL